MNQEDQEDRRGSKGELYKQGETHKEKELGNESKTQIHQAQMSSVYMEVQGTSPGSLAVS